MVKINLTTLFYKNKYIYIYIIKRETYLKKLLTYMDKDIIKIITGIRRCSKYYLLFEIYYNYLISNGIFKDQIIAISFE